MQGWKIGLGIFLLAILFREIVKHEIKVALEKQNEHLLGWIDKRIGR